MIPLPHKVRGRAGPLVVLLHGFAGDKEGWTALFGPLSKVRRTVVMDLPGHGAAVPWAPVPDAKAMADAVIASLDAMGIARAALVGHSLGGAVAALVGLLRPDLVARLILLAPGGFGPEMNARLLRHFAVARDGAALRAPLEGLFAPTAALPAGLLEGMVAAREDDALAASHAAIVGVITKGDGQGTLPLAKLAAQPFPVTLVWGEDDGILPVRQAHGAPAVFARHILPGVGHMPHLEAPALTKEILVKTLGV
ncbi:MAG: alpha/beta fold hydrolase [Pseudomonadota bacterium]